MPTVAERVGGVIRLLLAGAGEPVRVIEVLDVGAEGSKPITRGEPGGFMPEESPNEVAPEGGVRSPAKGDPARPGAGNWVTGLGRGDEGLALRASGVSFLGPGLEST